VAVIRIVTTPDTASFDESPEAPAEARALKVTVRVDASFDFPTRVVGVGLVVHETWRPEGGRQGVVVAELAEAYLDVAAGEMEAFAILRGLEVARARGATLARVRSDANPLRHRLKADHRAGTGHERADLHGQILRLARTFVGVQFAYQPRRKNHLAHRLARAARALAPIRPTARS